MFVNSAVVPLLTQNRELLGQKHNVVSSLRPSPFPSSCRKAEYCKNAEQICVTSRKEVLAAECNAVRW